MATPSTSCPVLTIALLIALLIALSLTGCSSQDDASAAKGDPRLLFEKITEIRSANTVDVIEPANLGEALPGGKTIRNRKTGQVESAFSDLLVTGRIVDVSPGNAVVYDDIDPIYPGNEEKFHTVDFDDRAAHERNVVVRVDPDWGAGEDVATSVEFRMGVLGGADPYEFMASLRGLQDSRVAIVLDARESGRDLGDYYPIMGGALIGRIGDGGCLSFPALGEDETSFVSDIDTVAELQAAAESSAADPAPVD